tara:strand:+ start:198 stop:1277 length:1080 start_codon:yes stop_codon:yes gene_type:complete
MNQVKEIIEQKRSIKEKTWKTYVRYMHELSNHVCGEDYSGNSFLEDKGRVSAILNQTDSDGKPLYGGSKKRVCASIILVFLSPDKAMAPVKRSSKTQPISFPEAASDLYKHYHGIQSSLTGEYTDKMATQTKTEKQSENWVEWPAILKLQRKYMNTIRREKFNKKETLDVKEKKLLQDYLILSLYTLIKPRRLDYAGMKIYTEDEYLNPTLELTTEATYQEAVNNFHLQSNCLVISSKIRKTFHFGPGAQKNENGGLGVYCLKVPTSLNRVLQLYLKHHEENFLLFNARRKGEISKDGLSKEIMKIFETAFQKRISASMLRTIHNTAFYTGPSLAEKKKAAEEMGHSVNTAELHYTKKD